MSVKINGMAAYCTAIGPGTALWTQDGQNFNRPTAQVDRSQGGNPVHLLVLNN